MVFGLASNICKKQQIRSAAGQQQQHKTNQKAAIHWPLVVRASRVWSRVACRARLFLFYIIAGQGPAPALTLHL